MKKGELLTEFIGLAHQYHAMMQVSNIHDGSFESCKSDTCVWYREVIRAASGVDAHKKPAGGKDD